MVDKPHPYFDNAGGAAHPYFGGHPTGYEQYIQENPDDVEMQKLCHEIFLKTEAGQKLYVLLLEKFLLPGLFAPEGPQAANLAIYFEGFKEAFRGLINMAKIHQRRIER